MAFANLTNQLAHLTDRVNHIRSLPMYAKAAHVDELVTLQLSLFGALVDRVNEISAAVNGKTP